MKIIVDAMGGDDAPNAVVSGVISALDQSGEPLEILLIGNENAINEELKKSGFSSTNLSVYHTEEVVTASDLPSKVHKRKPNSSLVKGINLLKLGEGDAFVSAGSTGAILSTSLFELGRIEGVKRPALGVLIPIENRYVMVCDVGTNIDVKPEYMVQFAIMSLEFLKRIYNVNNPKVALLNIGQEPNKGHQLYKDSYKLFNDHLKNFAGNIEARYILNGEVDVVICDGFTGNNLIKFAEGWIIHITKEVEEKLNDHNIPVEYRDTLKSIFMNIVRKFEFEEYGGLPLLGVNGVCFVCHGSSTSRAIKNAIFSARKSVEENLVGKIKEGITSSLSLI